MRPDPLPSGWCYATVGDLVEGPQNGFGKRRQDVGVPAVVLRSADIKAGEISLTQPRRVNATHANLEQYGLRDGDLLSIRVNGSLDLVGRLIRFRSSSEPVLFCDHFIRIRPTHPLLSRILRYYGDTNFARLQVIHEIVSSAGQGTIGQGSLLKLRISLPPLREQERIADALDELLSDLDAGVAALERVRAKLKLYRASVLKAAVEGTLTAEWRAQHPHTEPADKLLGRILAERRRQWEDDQFGKLKAKSQEPTMNWKGKYKEPVEPDTAKLPPLPEGWCWTTADQICTQITDGEHIQPRYQAKGRPMLSAKNVRDGFVDFGDVDFIAEQDFAGCLKRCAPTHNDVLIVSVGATTGRAAIVGPCDPFAIVRSVLLLRTLISARFLLFWIRAPWCQAYIGRASGSSAQAHLYIGDTKNIPVPLAPEAEREVIVEAAEDQLSVIDHIEIEVDAKLKNAQGLRQAILRHAFTGQLVSQDPNDEPASELLKRIAAERRARAREGGAGLPASTRNTTRAGRRRKTIKTKDQ